MSTLGTDGTTTSQTVTLPASPTTNVPQLDQSSGNTVPGAPAANSPAASGGGAGGGGGGGGSGSPTTQNSIPSGATSMPDDTVIPDDSGSIPVPTDTPSDEPQPPTPPILLPDLPDIDVPMQDNVDSNPMPVDDTPLPPSEDPTVVAEAPEPGTLTLLGLATVGGIGYARRKRQAKS